MDIHRAAYNEKATIWNVVLILPLAIKNIQYNFRVIKHNIAHSHTSDKLE
jgi:hypothetical protein